MVGQQFRLVPEHFVAFAALSVAQVVATVIGQGVRVKKVFITNYALCF